MRFTINILTKTQQFFQHVHFCTLRVFLKLIIQLNSTNGGGDGWESVSCPNGLADVHWLHVGSHKGSPRIDKEKRDVFVKGRIQDVRKQFQVIILLRFCFKPFVV